MRKIRRASPVIKQRPNLSRDAGTRLGAAILLAYAADYLRAAKKARVRGRAFRPAQFYLACHAIELSLDAYRAFRDPFGTRSGRDVPRRNLAGLFAESESRSLQRRAALTAQQRAQIRKASTYYAAMVFEYPATVEAVRGYPNKPDIDELIAAGSRLLTAMHSATKPVA